jgi:hypothetical protein
MSIMQDYISQILSYKTYPNYDKNLEWLCKPCSDSSKTTTTPLEELSIPQYGRGIKIAHINIRDLMSKSKLHDMRTILHIHNYDVFVITESWLWKNISDDEIQIPGYQMLRTDRPNIRTYNKRGGGILTYVKEEYKIKQNNSFSYPEKVQSIQFDISKQFIKPILFIALYRVSETPTRFIEELESEITNNRESEIYVIGDLNINQLSFKDNTLRPLMHRTSMKQSIKEPARITEESSSLIDVIMTNSPEYNRMSGVMRCSLSDHEIIYTVRKQRKTFNTRVETRTVRNFKNVDHEAVISTLNSAPWWAITDPTTTPPINRSLLGNYLTMNLEKYPLKNQCKSASFFCRHFNFQLHKNISG